MSDGPVSGRQRLLRVSVPVLAAAAVAALGAAGGWAGAAMGIGLAAIGGALWALRPDEPAGCSWGAAMEAVEDGLLVVDAGGRIAAANPGAARILRQPAGSLVGRNLADPGWSSQREDGSDWPGAEHPALVCLETGLPVRGEVLGVRRSDGGVLWQRICCARFAAGDGRMQVVVAFSDISAVRMQEAALYEVAAAAESAAVTKAEFLATMSHEIRTPLNGVIGMTGLLLDAGLDARQREYAETVRNSAESLLLLVNDILDFSKIDAGHLELEAIDFDPRQIAEEAVGLVAERAQGKGLDLVLDLDPAIPALAHGDPGRLRQVLVNLLGNAVKFTERGEVVLTMAADAPAAGRAGFRCAVRDTGIGIAPEVQGRLFNPFAQGDASTTRRFGGTGLGLAISRRLVEAMGGTITVSSVVGTGSEFRVEVELPVPRSEPPPAPVGLLGQRVLVAEPQASSRRVVLRQLAAWGCRATGAASLAEALAALSSAGDDRHALVLAAVRLPDGDGLELVRHAVDTGARALVLASLGDLPAEAALARVGAAGVVARPVRVSALATACSRETPSQALHRKAVVRFSGRVLVAEDNPVNQRVALALCTKLGLHADAVGNGEEAVQAALALPYDLVLMDCQMPVLDGFRATQELRRRLAGRRLPIVALTANAMEGDRERCLAAGMDDYLSKPIRQAALAEMFQRWLPGAATAARAPDAADGADCDDLAAAVARLREELGEDADAVLAEVLESFIAEGDQVEAELEAAAASGDIATMGRAAHRLRGQALTLGLGRLAAVCARLEAQARSGALPGLPALAAATREAWRTSRGTVAGALTTLHC